MESVEVGVNIRWVEKRAMVAIPDSPHNTGCAVERTIKVLQYQVQTVGPNGICMEYIDVPTVIEEEVK